MNEEKKNFVDCEYMEAPVKRSMEALYVDSYQSFGWQVEGSSSPEGKPDQVKLKLKRDRRLHSQAELTRLQRQFESYVHDVESLERSKTTAASAAAYVVGLVGTALLGLATFAYLGHSVPLMALWAVPGFAGWILPYFFYQKIKQSKTAQVTHLINQKQDEIYSVCEQASRLIRA